MAFPATFFAKHVYHPASLSLAFLTFKTKLFVMLSPLVAFPRYQEIAAGGFPITSRQGIDVSPPTSTSIILLKVVANGLSGHKKAERLGLTYKGGNLLPKLSPTACIRKLIEVHYWIHFYVTHNYIKASMGKSDM